MKLKLDSSQAMKANKVNTFGWFTCCYADESHGLPPDRTIVHCMLRHLKCLLIYSRMDLDVICNIK